MPGYNSFVSSLYCEGDWVQYSLEIGKPLLTHLSAYSNKIESVLDLACGDGSLCRFFYESGIIDCEGIDLSSHMIMRAKKTCDNCKFSIGSISSFSLGRKYDLITCVFNSLNHILIAEELADVFCCVSSHLSPKGTLFFDVLSPSIADNFVMPRTKFIKECNCFERVYMKNHDEIVTEFYVPRAPGSNNLKKGSVIQRLYSYDAILSFIQKAELNIIWESNTLPGFYNHFQKRHFFLVGLKE